MLNEGEKRSLHGEKGVRYSGHKAVNYQIILSVLWEEQLVQKLEKQNKTMKIHAVLFFSLLHSKNQDNLTLLCGSPWNNIH